MATPTPEPFDAAAATPRKKGLTRYEPGLEEEIFEFQRTAYPRRRPDWIEPRWCWMYLESARRLGVDPMTWVYHDGTKVVAHQGGIPVRLKIGAKERVTGWFVETMALETARGRTVGPAVIMKATEDLPFNISLGQTAAMRELQYRLGWAKVADLQTAQLLLNPEKVLKKKLKLASVSLIAGAAWRARTRFTRLLARPSLQGIKFAMVTNSDRRYDELWQKVQHDLTCAVVRDADYLAWKYARQPGQDFTVIELTQADELIASVVLSFSEPDNVYNYRRCFIVDVIVPLSDRSVVLALLEVARRCAVARAADAMICLHIGKSLTESLRAFGFILREPTRYLLVRPETLDEEERSIVLDPDNWFVTMGDSDIDRPW